MGKVDVLGEMEDGIEGMGEEGKVRGVLMVDEMDMGKEGFLEELGIVFKLEMD
ncbi:hypothetical protein [Siminovitchia fortis]|uniref:hypothetical protein n=1 Tax=Siminovitchia fortis TaxID=254758 RepID=UPI001643246B|nr:hypothetical protein [Siminovitchia fortis]